jgi:plasmid stabilization system protein ParE
MPRIRIIWTPEAQENLQEVRRFIARDAPRTARSFVNKITAKVRRLRDFPELGSMVEDLDRPEIRELLQGSYRILYRLQLPEIYILAVVHGARQLREKDLPS